MNNTVEEIVEETYKELFVKALNKINELERALDKACESLELLTKDINELHGYFDNEFVKKNEWKEWLLKDE